MPDAASTWVLEETGTAVARRIHKCEVTVCVAEQEVQRIVLEKPLFRIGSGPGNDVVIDDRTVSRIHFQVRADEHGYRLTDQESRNGTYVDGVRALDIYLRDGARIRVGETDIMFRHLAATTDLPLFPTERFGPLVGRSPAMRELFTRLSRVAQTDSTVLIEGPSGTGKELVAHALHQASRRARGAFVVVDCGAIPAHLVESHFFGHERGAFTGATTRHIGYAEEANGGTLFLDEIGELPLHVQPRLLRLLESRSVRRVGGNAAVSVDARVLAATNKDLACEVNLGSFREDLFYRLAVIELDVPPLRRRREDIRPLVEYFVGQSVADPMAATKILSKISEKNWQHLERHPWPGNVRELRNMVLRTLALAGSAAPGEFDPGAVASAAIGRSTSPLEVPVDVHRPFMDQKQALVRAFEQCYAEAILAEHKGNLSRAAHAAGLERMQFKRIVKKYEE